MCLGRQGCPRFGFAVLSPAERLERTTSGAARRSPLDGLALQTQCRQALQALVHGVHFDAGRLQRGDAEQRLDIPVRDDHATGREVAHELDESLCEVELYLPPIRCLVDALAFGL